MNARRNPDGTFDEVRIDAVPRSGELPPGQARSAGAEDVEGTTFGWQVGELEGEYSINLVPGDFIAYDEPWERPRVRHVAVRRRLRRPGAPGGARAGGPGRP